ncbi:interferon regulatory factor 3 isoform X4 [Petaurus breviceps papuanus]|uniref:interferon regulatory factor 3 isoform X4 n=1 Tax=Petaurus breviceps papuanus TaxID=3040969 RepID=UPI0036DAF16E
MANKTKPRILPWLREQLDSGHLGATWINAEHTRFFIPWKHGLRRDLGQEDFRIFQEEAIQEIMGALSLSTQQQQQDQFGAFSTSSNLEQLPQTPEPALSCNPLMPLFASGLQSEYEVTAFYRGRQVLQKCLFCLKGLRLVGPGPGAETWMELEGTPLALPEPSSTLTDQRAAHFISRVLGSLGAGLALWTSQTELRAQRLGHCGAHWALGEQASPGATGKEVTKERAGQQVCYIPEFVNDLISFLQGSHRSPQYTLWFCLGESWPTESQLWTKKLVMVKVVPTALRALHEVAQAGGASSLEEVDLHISGSLSLSLAPAHLHDYLQGLAHSMQWESGAHC